MKLARLAVLPAACILAQTAFGQWSAPEVEELFGSTSWGPSIWAGESIDFDGVTLAVGAPGVHHPSGTNHIGYVHLFEQNAEGVWNQIQLIKASDHEAFAVFGTSVAIDGDTLVVGSPYHSGDGAAYVFTRVPGGGGSFAEVAKLASGSSVFGTFGDAVDVDGDVIVVGDESWSNAKGRAHVFERDQGGPGAWGMVATLPASPFFQISIGRFGASVAVRGDTAVIGATGTKEAHVFERDQGGTGAWGEVAELSASNPHPNGNFGEGLDIDGDMIVASAGLSGPKSAGEIYVFERDQGGPDAWGEVAHFQGSGLTQFARFASSLSLSGDLLAAGTPDIFGQGTGQAHVFHRNQGGANAWGEVARLDPSDGAADDEFGMSVSIVGATLWVGAPLHDEDGPDAGAVYGFAASHAPEGYCTAGTSGFGCVAVIGAAGTASATASSGFDLTASSVEGRRNGLFFFGASGRQANPWGNGTSYQCVLPPVKRSGPMIGIGTSGLCDGAFAFDLNAHWCPTCPKPNHNPGAGALVQAQLWYRDPQNSSNQTTSLSGAIELLVEP